MLSPHLSNPYARNTPEHSLWARWHRAFFDQPTHSQLLVIESQLRQSLSALLALNARAPSTDLQREFHAHLIEVEESVNLLNETAEHAFIRIVTRRPSPVNGRQNP